MTETTKSLSELDQEWTNTLKEYNVAKIAKQCGKDVENLLEVLELALDRINSDIEKAMAKNEEQFPYDPDEDDREDREEELASQRHDW